MELKSTRLCRSDSSKMLQDARQVVHFWSIWYGFNNIVESPSISVFAILPIKCMIVLGKHDDFNLHAFLLQRTCILHIIRAKSILELYTLYGNKTIT